MINLFREKHFLINHRYLFIVHFNLRPSIRFFESWNFFFTLIYFASIKDITARQLQIQLDKLMFDYRRGFKFTR